MEQVCNLPLILLEHFVKDRYHVPTSDNFWPDSPWHSNSCFVYFKN